MADDDQSYRLPKRVTLNVAAVYLPTYKESNDFGNFKAAEALLEKHNIGLQLWPAGGAKLKHYSLPIYSELIKDERAVYQQLAKDVFEFLKNKAPGYPFVQPVVFCDFQVSAVAITPHASKVGLATPLCLVSSRIQTMKDNMTILHEMGHAVLYPDASHAAKRGDLMHEADGRKYMTKKQVEAFGKAYFARATKSDVDS